MSGANGAAILSKGSIQIPENKHVVEPIVIRLGSVPAENSISIRAGAHSIATIYFLFEDAALETESTAIQIFLASGARLSMRSLQKKQTTVSDRSLFHAHLQQHSVLSFGQLWMVGSETQAQIHVELQGEGASVDLFGLYLPTQQQKMNLQLRVDHLAPRTISHQYYKGVLQDESFAAWTSRVYMHENAKGSVSKQKNQTLLLSAKAEIQAKPELEIDQDDVKCAHGATVGQLDAEALFYLQSRGIPSAVARELLIEAFSAELMEKLDVKDLFSSPA